ncbi:DUF2190 family protein [Rhodosalinus sp. K401]|uniref:DUF2190 family protein n=1 Tax=Rhodosalinus sp. K401 TaxID=3239195 RepID=UPI00352335DA
MKNFIQTGDTLTIPAPAAVTSGAVVIAGGLVGIAATDAESGADVAIATAGVFDLPKEAALEITLGDAVYWDADPGVVTTTATDNTALGVAVAGALAAASSVRVKIG